MVVGVIYRTALVELARFSALQENNFRDQIQICVFEKKNPFYETCQKRFYALCI